MRTIVPCRKPDEALIEGYTCSRCSWFYALAAPRPFEVPEEEVRQACREFERHDCAEFPARAGSACA